MKYVLLSILAFFLLCCNSDEIKSVDREDLFSLELGPMEDQIALYNLEGNRGIRRMGFTMRDGFIYVADGNSGKILRFNSYGDLLFMIYNDYTNPPPISLKTNLADDQQATRWAHSYPLEEPGWIAVDSRKHIFVEDRLPNQATQIDNDTGAILDGIICHFDQDGRFINYIGQDGIGGNPFPRIIGLTASIRDELAVICRLPDGWNVYWFNSAGMLLYLLKITANTIPLLADWPEALANVDRIMASPDSRHLYIKVDYSRDIIDPSTGTRTTSEPINSVIWTLNVEDGMFIKSTEAPLYENYDTSRGTQIKVFYSLLGVSKSGKVLLYFPVETGYSLLYVDTHSSNQNKGSINFTYDEIRYNDFYLSSEGILTAMLADLYHVKFAWWRTDRLMGDW